MNFEAFGSSPDFTTPIQQFLFNNCSKIEEAKKSGEQSINNYMLFKQYSELMDKTLEKFLDCCCKFWRRAKGFKIHYYTIILYYF